MLATPREILGRVREGWDDDVDEKHFQKKNQRIATVTIVELYWWPMEGGSGRGWPGTLTLRSASCSHVHIFLLDNFQFRMSSRRSGTTHSHFAPLRVRVLAPSALARENALGMTHPSKHDLHYSTEVGNVQWTNSQDGALMKWSSNWPKSGKVTFVLCWDIRIYLSLVKKCFELVCRKI